MVAFISNCSTVKGWFGTKLEEPTNILSLSIDDHIKMADSYFNKKKYNEAIQTYKEFEKLHPTNKSVPYCIYREGLIHYRQKTTFDRDQTHTQKAIEEFSRLKQKFPSCEYISQVDQYLAQCRIDLEKHEFYIAEFYFKTKRYQAAMARYQALLNDHPESSKKVEVQKKIEECQRLMNVKPKTYLFGLFDAKW
jgi:outer membrane protein assembly factor BamD